MPSIIVKIPGTSTNLGKSSNSQTAIAQNLTSESRCRSTHRLCRQHKHRALPRSRRRRKRHRNHSRSLPRPRHLRLQAQEYPGIPLLRRRRRRSPRLRSYFLKLPHFRQASPCHAKPRHDGILARWQTGCVYGLYECGAEYLYAVDY